MESFADWHSPDQIEGATLDELTIATEHLSGLTAAFWDKPVREDYPWLRNILSPAFKSLLDDHCNLMATALTRLGDSLPKSSEQAIHVIGSKYRPLMAKLSSGHQALSHWDYWVENLFLARMVSSQLLIVN